MKILRKKNVVFKNIINDFMTNISTTFQDLTESKLKFVENQFTSEHDDTKHFAKNHFAKNLIENIAKNLK